VIDLSRIDLDAKREYVSVQLPRIALLRRRIGVPHRIVLDEAHYFLDSSNCDALLDLQLAGNTLASYRISQLPHEVVEASEAIIATRVSDQREAATLVARVGGCEARTQWSQVLASLPLGDAVLLPTAPEAKGSLCHFHLAPRLTPHVRHLHKYLDVPVSGHLAFVFTRDGRPTGQRARTLRELADTMQSIQPDVLTGHLHRGDLSRWISDVFADEPLAARLRDLEQQCGQDLSSDARSEIARLIQERCMLTGDEV
jgi:hypothetical protein